MIIRHYCILSAEMPSLKGFSETNLKMMRTIFEERENLESKILKFGFR